MRDGLGTLRRAEAVLILARERGFHAEKRPETISHCTLTTGGGFHDHSLRASSALALVTPRAMHGRGAECNGDAGLGSVEGTDAVRQCAGAASVRFLDR